MAIDAARRRGHRKKLRADSGLYVVFQLAEHLHKTAEEIFRISESELVHWLAYFKVKAEKERAT